MGTVKRAHRIQSVTALDGMNLLVSYETYLEHWRCRIPIADLARLQGKDFTVERVISHPLMAGIRTVQPLDEHRAVVACSALDGILVINWRTGEVEQVLRLPFDLYGFNYDLSQKTDLRLHYINNNRQMTHVNGAWPLAAGKGVLVSTLIQGAIGHFDLVSGDYREITQGYVGCHGVRTNSAGEIYFADSCNGSLVFLDENGTVTRTFETDSKWLHDVTQIDGDCYAFSMADKNQLHCYDINTGQQRFHQALLTCPHPLLAPFYWWLPGWIGNSTMFASFASAARLQPKLCDTRG